MKKTVFLALCLALTSSGVAAQTPEPDFTMKQYGAVRWVCGGYGANERAALARLEPRSDLKLVFAAGKNAVYVSQVLVWMNDEEGKQKPLQFRSDGPICLIQAPAGRYRFEASYGNATRNASASVVGNAKRPAMVVFRFPEPN
jgi:hypothetical protein